MITTFVISFREFLEVFLIIGVFLGISRKLQLKKERELVIASIVGITFSLLLPVIVFFLGEKAGTILNEKNAELLEGYLMVFSGFFLAYVIFSLHNLFVLQRSKTIIAAHKKMQDGIFDISLFLLIIFFITREGFEIALFTTTTSLFTKFAENLFGLLMGFAASSVLGLATFFAYLKIPIMKIYKLTEYVIILLGASLVKNGLNELLEIYVNLHLSNIVPIKLVFLPHKSTLVGHMLRNIIGIEQNFSLAKLGIMIAYIFIIYLLFLKKEIKKT